MAKIKRSQFKSFLNTGTVGTPVWSLISAGIPEAEVAMNPKTSDNATISVESYAPTMAIEATAIAGDAVFDWIDATRQGRDVLEDAETEIVNVWLFETPALGYYAAEKVAVSVQVDKFGGPGNTSAKIGYTINYVGDPVKGGFSPTGSEFVALAIDTILTTMVIGSVTLTPLFATDKSWLWYAGSVANGVTTAQMDSTLSGATIVQYDEAAEVLQGATASLAVGVNQLSIDVTVGTENVVYMIDITRAAA